MGKFRFVFILMCVLALCIPSCTSHADNQEELETKISTGSRSAIQISEEHRQIVEVAKHIKFETDTFFLDITLEEAKKQGLAEEAYNMWQERVKVYTQEAREVISKGGDYTFINTYAECENNISQYSEFSRYRNFTRYSDEDDVYLDTFSYEGTVVYPSSNQCIISFTDPAEASFFKAIRFFFDASVYNEIEATYVLAAEVEHRVYLEGYKKHPWGAVEKYINT